MRFAEEKEIKNGNHDNRSLCCCFRWINLFYVNSPTEKNNKSKWKHYGQAWNQEIALLQQVVFYGTILDVMDDTVIVEFGNNKNCRIPMQKQAIAQIEKANGASVDEK